MIGNLTRPHICTGADTHWVSGDDWCKRQSDTGLCDGNNNVCLLSFLILQFFSTFFYFPNFCPRYVESNATAQELYFFACSQKRLALVLNFSTFAC